MWNDNTNRSFSGWANRLRRILENLEKEDNSSIQKQVDKGKDNLDSLLYIELSEKEKEAYGRFNLNLKGFTLWRKFYRYVSEDEKDKIIAWCKIEGRYILAWPDVTNNKNYPKACNYDYRITFKEEVRDRIKWKSDIEYEWYITGWYTINDVEIIEKYDDLTQDYLLVWSV